MPQPDQPPPDNDIICGRGAAGNHHPGNVVFRLITFLNKDLYDSIPREEQKLVAVSIVESLRNGGRRFVKKDTKTGAWVEIEYDMAIEKTKQRIRDIKIESTWKGKNIPLENNPLLYHIPKTSSSSDGISTMSIQQGGREFQDGIEPIPSADPRKALSATSTVEHQRAEDDQQATTSATTLRVPVESVAHDPSCQGKRRSKFQKDRNTGGEVPAFTAAPAQGTVKHHEKREQSQRTKSNLKDDLAPIAVLPSVHANDDYEQKMGEAELLRNLKWLQENQLFHACMRAESDGGSSVGIQPTGTPVISNKGFRKTISVGSISCKNNSQRTLAASEITLETIGSFPVPNSSNAKLRQRTSAASEFSDESMRTFPFSVKSGLSNTSFDMSVEMELSWRISAMSIGNTSM